MKNHREIHTKYIASIPSKSQNPYLSLFYNSLCRKRHKLVDINPFFESNKLNFIDIVHIHWPEVIWKNFFFKLYQRIPFVWRFEKKISFFESFCGSLFFMIKLKSLKRHVSIIWTCHNIRPHENESLIERAAYKYLAKHSDLIIFHSKISKKEFNRKFKTIARQVIMYHGNYIGFYPNHSTKNELFEKFNLHYSKPIVLMIGSIREYKGIDIALDAASELREQAQFVFAGNPHPSFDIVQVKNRLKRISNAVSLFKHLNDQEFIDLLHYSDVVILPYKKISSSGALLAALSFGKGVVVSDLPYFREILSFQKNAGMLVEPGNSKALAEGIRHFLKIDPVVRKKAAKNLSTKFNWDKVILPVIKAIDNL